MPSLFPLGHALLIGAGDDLPNTVDDANGLAAILRDPERCAYPEKQVHALTGADATRATILTALDALAKTATPDSTVVVYFSGHGYQVASPTGEFYYLLPNGYDVQQLYKTAISGVEFTGGLKAIPAQKLLVLLDCCHAGGVGEAKAPGLQMTKAPLPPEAAALFAQGRGRVLIASSRADELSYAGKPYSAFTLALIEALCGEGASKRDGYVRVADMALHAREKVPGRTKQRQHPVMHFEHADNFVMAYYAGGDSAPKAPPFRAQEIAIEPEPGAWRGFNQSGQTVHGPQTNIQGDVKGPVLSGNFQAPVTIGDIKVGNVSGTGHAIGHGAQSVVNTGSGAVATGGGVAAGAGGIAVGGNVQGGIVLNQGVGPNTDELERVIAALMKKVKALADDADKAEGQAAVKMLEAEAQKAEQANEGRVKRSMETLVEILPDAWEVAVDTVINPLAGLNIGFKKIAERVKVEKEKKSAP